MDVWELSHYAKQRPASGRCVDQRTTTVNWGALKRDNQPTNQKAN
jgi:hypothetical protein